ncbi:MAG TPA: CBS domain-containing protein [Gemmataceae bacterium]|nr:CBS domain-containing protein [Gemmataceae bacterium]
MICPTCGTDNLPGNETCAHCQQDLTPLDRPIANNRVERSLMEDPVSALRPRKPVTVAPTAKVRDAIDTMLKHDLGAVLVVAADGTLVGILSERDLLTKVAILPDPYEDLSVEDFMTANPETVTATDTLAFALHKMDIGGYRHMPILADGLPSGMISVRDMLRHITRLCKE